MNIYNAPYIPRFKGNTKQENNIPSENDFIKTLKSGKPIDFTVRNSENNKTLFQIIVENDYKKLISYMLVNKFDFSNVISLLNDDEMNALNDAKSLEMRLLLKTIKKLSSSNIKPKQDSLIAGNDAKIIATKQFMTKPVMEKVQTAISEKQTAPIDFFDSMEEVNAETITEKSDTTKTNATNVIDATNTKNINIKGIEDFNLLKLSTTDLKSLDELIGLSELKKELKSNVILPLTNESTLIKLKDNNVDLPNGILFQGEDGILSIVKALSAETKTPVIILERPQELEQILTAVEARYKKTGAKTIILAQGFDKFFNSSSQPDIEANIFKNKIKNIRKSGGLFIATTTDKANINCDFMKSGIIDKVLDVKKPTKDDRKTFITNYIKTKDLFKKFNNEDAITKLVKLTDNLSYKDIIRVLEETVRISISNGNNADISAFEKELEKFIKETERTPITPENKTAAYDSKDFKRIPIEKGEMMSLDELGGMDEIKKQLRELYVEPMKNIDEMTEMFGSDAIPDGAILYGAPGNGKTVTARVLARELGLPYYETRLSDFGTALVHESGKAFKQFAEQLDNKFKETGERSVWFLDEFDCIGGSRNGNNFVDRELTNTLLQEFSNPAQRGYILLAATNNLEDVDAALKRRGRLGNWIEFKNPNLEERVDTIKKNLLKHKFTQELANDEKLVLGIAKELDGFSFSSIVNVLKDAKRDFYLNKTDFSKAIKKALDANLKRERGEFCDKTGLKEHVYEDWNFKSLDELGGMSNVVQQLKDYVVDAWNPEVRKVLIANKRMPSGGFILEGPPGNGKTTAVETLARDMNLPLYKMNYNQEGNEYAHRLSKNIHEIFDKLALEAKVLKKPVILFFDEAEKFFPKTAESYRIEEVNTYKELMNLAASKNIILAGATNHIDLINQEIVGNPRRMGTIIHCGNPDFEDRTKLIKNLFSGLSVINGKLTDNNIKKIAKLTDGFSIGQISDAVDKIVVQAIKKKTDFTPETIINEFKTNIKPDFYKK